MLGGECHTILFIKITLEKMCFLHNMEKICNLSEASTENMVNLITRIVSMATV